MGRGAVADGHRLHWGVAGCLLYQTEEMQRDIAVRDLRCGAAVHLESHSTRLMHLVGQLVKRTDEALNADPSSGNRAWARFKFGAIASIALWLSTTLAGVILLNS